MWHCKVRHCFLHTRQTTCLRCYQRILMALKASSSEPKRTTASPEGRPISIPISAYFTSPAQTDTHTEHAMLLTDGLSSLKQSPEYLTTGQWIMSQMTKVPNKWPQQQHLKICGREHSNMQKRKQIKYTINQSKNNAWQSALSITPCHIPSLAFQHPSSKFCQNWICHWGGTHYLCSAVHQCYQCPLKGLDTDKTVKKHSAKAHTWTWSMSAQGKNELSQFRRFWFYLWQTHKNHT